MSNSMFCPAHESTRKQLVLTVGLLLSIELFITDMLKVVNIQLTGALFIDRVNGDHMVSISNYMYGFLLGCNYSSMP